MVKVVGNMTLKQHGLWDNLFFITSSEKEANTQVPRRNKSEYICVRWLPSWEMRSQKTDGYIHLADGYAMLCGLADVNPTDEEAV